MTKAEVLELLLHYVEQAQGKSNPWAWLRNRLYFDLEDALQDEEDEDEAEAAIYYKTMANFHEGD